MKEVTTEYVDILKRNKADLIKIRESYDILNTRIKSDREKVRLQIIQTDKEINEYIEAARNNGCFDGVVNDILKIVCEYYKVFEANIRKNKPAGNIEKEAKKAWLYLCCKLLNENTEVRMTLQDIAFYVGVKNHATILSAKNKVGNELLLYPKTKEHIDNLLIKCNLVIK